MNKRQVLIFLTLCMIGAQGSAEENVANKVMLCQHFEEGVLTRFEINKKGEGYVYKFMNCKGFNDNCNGQENLHSSAGAVPQGDPNYLPRIFRSENASFIHLFGESHFSDKFTRARFPDDSCVIFDPDDYICYNEDVRCPGETKCVFRSYTGPGSCS